MDIRDVFEELIRWTPFLAGGFVWNIVISIVSMLLGTALGAALAFMRESQGRLAVRSSLTLTEVARNVPTFVFLFYLAYLLPAEFTLLDITVPLPAWLKASLALSIAVVGFVSDTMSLAIRDWRNGQHEAAALFVPSWIMYLLIIIMASSTASVIGVSEIVARCNTVIAATGKLSLLLWIYFYAMLWFFLFCYPLISAMNWLKSRIQERRLTPQPG
jgi:polar amino acid transport system permease protein